MDDDKKTIQINKTTLAGETEAADNKGDTIPGSPAVGMDKTIEIKEFTQLPDWTLIPGDVDLDQLLAEDLAHIRERETEPLDPGKTIAASPVEDLGSTIAITPDQTQQIREGTIKGTIKLDWDQDEKATRRTIAATVPEIDWKEAENEESGYKGNEGRITSYGLDEGDAEYMESIAAPEEEEIQDKINTRKKENEARSKRNRLKLKIFLILLASSIFLFVFSLSSVFTVDAIEVRGNSHFTAEEIINIGHAVPGKNLIYSPGKKEIVQYLEQNPYIKKAEVTRKLPSTLVINVEERQQAFVFAYDDDFLVIDDDGILLNKSRTQPKLTVVKGLVVTKIKLGQTIGTKDKKLFQNTLGLIKTMKASDLYFVTIEMGEDDAVKAYIYDSLIVKGNYDLIIKNLENGRLHKVVEELFSKNIKRGTITFGIDGSISFEPGI